MYELYGHVWPLYVLISYVLGQVLYAYGMATLSYAKKYPGYMRPHDYVFGVLIII